MEKLLKVNNLILIAVLSFVLFFISCSSDNQITNENINMKKELSNEYIKQNTIENLIDSIKKSNELKDTKMLLNLIYLEGFSKSDIEETEIVFDVIAKSEIKSIEFKEWPDNKSKDFYIEKSFDGEKKVIYPIRPIGSLKIVFSGEEAGFWIDCPIGIKSELNEEKYFLVRGHYEK